jgi:2-(1,2-epoxy-1,2-dihydrophenyl)acetyl-CoA isomerase
MIRKNNFTHDRCELAYLPSLKGVVLRLTYRGDDKTEGEKLVAKYAADLKRILGDKVSAEEAERMGMIYKVLTDEDFEEASLAIATQLSLMPTLGLALTKAALNHSMQNDLLKQLDLEDQLQTKAGESEDYQEGTKAFLEKRKPEFKGR